MTPEKWTPHPIDVAQAKIFGKVGGEETAKAFLGMCEATDGIRDTLYAMLDDYIKWKSTPEGRKAIRKWHRKSLKLSPKFSRDELNLKIHEGRMRKHRARLGDRK